MNPPARYMDASQRTLQSFLRFSTFILVILVLYLGRDLLMPLALAALFAFLLHPLVKVLCRWGLSRTVSVLVVTVAVFSGLALLAWLGGGELHHLAGELPNHRQNIQERITAIQNVGEGGVIARLREMVAEISTSALEAGAGPVPAPDAPAPSAGGGLAPRLLDSTLTTLANGLGVGAVVVVFVLFMLLRQEDISSRFVKLAGYSRLTTTTKAIDETGERISRYLLMQASINGAYGLLLAAGLALIGLPYVVLWGVAAALFRFIPYIGPWIVAVLPLGLSLAFFDGWSQPLMVLGLILTLELATNFILEPLLYGQSAGVSDFALLVAISFWTWLWGGIGLVLATPLTVCLVVICKYIPALDWVEVLMGDKPLPQPHLTAYQRLVAGDEDAFQNLIHDAVVKQGFIKTLEEISLPALVLTRREAVLGKLDKAEERQLYETLGAISALAKDWEPAPAEDAKTRTKTDSAATGEADPAIPEETAEPPKTLPVLARALAGEADVQALHLLEATLPDEIAFQISSDNGLIGEFLKEAEEARPALLCLSAMPPGSQMAAEVLCRRLHHKLPGLKILVCRWILPGQFHDPKSFKDAGATWVASTLTEAREVLTSQIR